MFKSILPSRRQSPDFTMVTAPPDTAPNGKENHPDSTTAAYQATAKSTRAATNKGAASSQKNPKVKVQDIGHPMEAVVMNQAFDKLLDDLQIPSTLRPKLATMDSTVKAAMLKSSQIPMFKHPASPPLTPHGTLRRAHSSDSLSSPRPPKSSAIYDFPRPSQIGFTHHPSKSVVALGDTNRIPSGHARGTSFDVLQTLGRGQAPPFIPTDLATGKPSKDKGVTKDITPSKYCAILSNTSSTQLEVEIVKKLRLLLRNESASWSQEFLRLGGYAALLTRLNEILEVEWREEQHDDQILHELLRCFKALATSSIGCFALRSSCPTPFVQLVALLYSDKKPGEVGTRQLIVELLLLLFELYPPSALPGTGGRPVGMPSQPTSLITLPAPHKTLFSLMRALLLTPAPPPAESPAAPVSPHAFIESLHRARVYKTYLQEVSDVCRDYFWVFCHPNNTIWCLGDTDEGKVEKPRAPGGMTGGVEFEAMGYFTTHMKLLNAIAKAAEDLNRPHDDEHSAHRLHADLFLSGFERILLIARKASTTYYPTLHLELARYVAYAGRARFELPWAVSRLVGPPPAALCKPGRAPKSPSKKATTAAAILPSAKIEPIKFD